MKRSKASFGHEQDYFCGNSMYFFAHKGNDATSEGVELMYVTHEMDSCDDLSAAVISPRDLHSGVRFVRDIHSVRSRSLKELGNS